MDREGLYSLVEEKINDVFLEHQTKNKIESGDITPMQALRLEKMQNELTNLIMDIGSENK